MVYKTVLMWKDEGVPENMQNLLFLGLLSSGERTRWVTEDLILILSVLGKP